MNEANFLVSFGADFLETWLSTVEYARRFAAFHEPRGNRQYHLVYVGPRRSLTAANADRVILVAAGDEYLVSIGILITIKAIQY
jgi:formylmethanofuran dehydrogenase subunit B